MSLEGLYGEWVNGLARGCELCIRGDKTVVFVTGRCLDNCFYCPISRERRSGDSVYVDEERVESIDDIVRYIETVGGEGASITGGDPLLVLDRTVEIIRRLKREFGQGFHIHLYTSGRLADRGSLEALERAGLDEIRFHPVDKRYLERVRTAIRETSMDIGIEVPALPGGDEWIRGLVLFLEEAGRGFVNINELEVSETNREALLLRGYRVSGDGVSIEGSRETALRVLRWARERGLRTRIHYCPARLKDAVQTLRRLRRIGERVRHPHQRVSGEGLLTWVEVDTGRRSLYVERVLGEALYYYRDGRYYVDPVVVRDREVVEKLKKRYRVFYIERSPVVLGRVPRSSVVENIYEL